MPTARQQSNRPRVTVERVDTEPLTVDQYRDAVAALAALIDRWTQPGKGTLDSDTREDAADAPDAFSLSASDHEAA